jgi:hypothetical protein
MGEGRANSEMEAKEIATKCTVVVACIMRYTYLACKHHSDEEKGMKEEY